MCVLKGQIELHWWCNGLHAHSPVKPRTMKLAFAIFLKNTYH